MLHENFQTRGKALADDLTRREYRVRFDVDGRILGQTVQSSLSEDLGMTVESGHDITIFDYLQRFKTLDPELPQRLETRVFTLIQEHEEFSLSGDIFIKDESHHIRVSGQAIDNVDGGTSYTLLLLDDTLHTHRRRMYEYMFRLANHELKGPLASIMGAVEFAHEHARSASIEGIEYCLEMISRNASVIEEMTQRYLNLSRIESGLITINASDMLISEIVLKPLLAQMEPYLSKRRMTVRFETRGFDHEPLVHADPEKVDIVLRNLLSNAAKYGTVDTPIDVYIKPGEGEAEVSVRNEGPNIPTENLDKLFERFVRLEATQGTKGSGLGLYNARKVIEMWGGRISVASGDDAIVFTFTLPLAKSEATKKD